MIELGENQLSNTKNLFKAIYDNSPIGIEIYDSNRKLIDLNQSCMDLFGVSSKDDVKGFDLFNDPNISMEYLTKLKKRESVRYERMFDFDLIKRQKLYNNKKSGKIYIDVLITPLFLKDNEFISNYLVQVQDISAQKRAEQKLVAFNEELENRILEKTNKLNKLEAKWRALVEEAPNIILTIDPNGDILYINKDFFMKKREEVIGTNVLDYINTEYHEIFRLSIEKVVQIGKSKYYEISGNRPNNNPVWYSFHIGAIKQGEDITSFMIQANDITKKKIIEQKLRESKEKFKMITEQSIIGIGILQDGLVKYASKKLADIYGYSVQELLNFKAYKFLRLIDPKFLDLVRDQSLKKQLGQENVITHYEHKIIKKTGEKRWIENYSKTINYESKPADLVINIDITERKKAEEKIRESESKYRKLTNQYKMLLESITDGVYALNRDWEYILVNKNAERLINMSIKNLLGNKIYNVFPGIDQTSFFKIYDKVMKTRNSDRVIDSFMHPDGHQGYYEVNVYPIKEGILCIGRDISEEKQIEQKLKQSEERFRIIAEQSALGILIIQNRNFKFVNKAFSEIIEYPLEVIKNWTVEKVNDIVFEKDLVIVKEKIQEHEICDYNKIMNYECRVLTKRGKIKWLEVTSKPIDYMGKYSILISVIDITVRKRVEEELKEISRLKSEFLSRTSHELKTPLVSIKGYTDLLLNQHYEMIDTFTISVLNEIKQGCHRLESLTKDLLEASKLESEEMKLYKSEEDLAFLIRFCVRDLRGLLNIRNHNLILDIQDNMITMMEKEKVYEVIMNLLSNAIKYTPSNGQILIKSEIKENKYQVSIIDNGIGLTESEKVKIFKRFGKIERYGKGMDVISEGSGLGLYISKKIIELHGGEIWVESEGRNKGSSFFFSLPIIKK